MLEVLRGCRDHQDGCGKTLPLIADGNLPAELKTRGWNTVAGSDPEPRRAFWPRKTGTNRGRSRPRCGFSRVRIVLGRYAQLFVGKLEFPPLGFEVLKIGVGEDEVENQQPRPNEVGGVEPMVPKLLLANQIVNLP